MPNPQVLIPKLRIQLKLSISRLRLLQSKLTALSKSDRRDLATLLESGKVSSARIRVEKVIASDVYIEALEMLELYCELLLARMGVFELELNQSKSAPQTSNSKLGQAASNSKTASKSGQTSSASTQKPSNPGSGSTPISGSNQVSTSSNLGSPESHSPSPPSNEETPLDESALYESISTIIYASPRVECKELLLARNILAELWGKERTKAASEGVGVSEKLLRKLKVETPTRELVEGYLNAIGGAYGVQGYGDHGGKDIEGEGPVEVSVPQLKTDDVESKIKEDKLGRIPDADELAARFAMLKR
ncbi:hypothetical protein K470DRAFT_259421 [Piedraia hortae CBS 480.64]|uniref:DUF292-domain-containing protein n=1 Tax=Piedraia hortae CBS 480.64 TaxID=1314780 RepID=A0A6A7BUR1_9PEZI|nr:hypothetical protein K470DRAFT_259421 [Piedraia hortae CBS 480.64]